MKNKSKKIRESLLKQTERSYREKDSYGSYKSIFKEGLDVQFWDCKQGSHIIDILPYEAGENNPKASPGDFTYVLDLWVHYNIGPNDDSYICLSKTYGKPCPVCEYIKKARKSGDYDEEEIDSIKPRRRTVYAIICYDSPEEEEKGIQIWEVAHYFMERHLVELARNPRTGGFIVFADPGLEGKSVQFSKKGRGAGNVEFIGHKFLDRDYEISEDIVESVPCLDDLIYIPTYEEVYKVFYGKNPDEEKESSRRVRVPKETKTIDADKGEESFEEDDDEKNEPSKDSNVKNRRKDVEVDGTTEEADKEDKVEDTSTCPAGGVFGRDCDELDYCGGCEFYDNCYEEQQRLEEERKKRRSLGRRRRR